MLFSYTPVAANIEGNRIINLQQTNFWAHIDTVGPTLKSMWHFPIDAHHTNPSLKHRSWLIYDNLLGNTDQRSFNDIAMSNALKLNIPGIGDADEHTTVTLLAMK